MLNPQLLAILRCPKCRGVLKEVSSDDREALTCDTCQLRYAVEDNIPNLLIEEAEHLVPAAR